MFLIFSLLTNKVMDLCDKLARMTRYTLQHQDKEVTVQDEISKRMKRRSLLRSLALFYSRLLRIVFIMHFKWLLEVKDWGSGFEPGANSQNTRRHRII